MPPQSSQIVDHDAEVVDLPRDMAPESSPSPKNQLDLTSAIALWKTNPKLYIQQERQKTMIRTRDAKMMAAATIGRGPSFYILKFPQFARLPLELRLMIWEVSARVPRVVEFNSCKKRFKLASRTSVPAILHVNKEARYIGLRQYEEISLYDLDKNVGFTFMKWEIDIGLFTTSKALETFLSQQASPVNPAFRCNSLAVRVEDTVLSYSPIGPGTQLSRLEELILIRNKKKNDRSTSNLILSGSPEFIDDQKTINEFNTVMRHHTLPASVVVKWCTRKDVPIDAISMKKEKAMKEQYDSDLLFAAQLQEDLDRRG
ncbi:hypothetical protein DL98DRAFT_640545 [Cadophora sp. DSE1049]|nr:hypothetical protein DL98DRAFT_640545 [Cadophora sp. DSE1049]